MGYRVKIEKKKYFLFFTESIFIDSKWWDFSHSICSQIQTVPIRTRCLCPLCRGKGHAHIIKSTGSRLGKRLLSKCISQKPFLADDLADDRYKKNLRICLPWRTIPFLYSICAASTVFLRTELFSLVRAAVYPTKPAPRCCCWHSATLAYNCCVLLIFQWETWGEYLG